MRALMFALAFFSVAALAGPLNDAGIDVSRRDQTASVGKLRLMDIGGTMVQVYVPDAPPARLSADGLALSGGQPQIFVLDPNPPRGPLRVPPPEHLRPIIEKVAGQEAMALGAATASFTIDYVPANSLDSTGNICTAFPETGKAAFNAAAAIWANLVQSAVPITIRACWTSMTGSTIGYLSNSTENWYRNFTGAPQANTWYRAALANALSGSDRNSAAYDMHITYNSNFSWYYGTDGNTPTDKVDLMSVVLHEIAHGLNFSGLISYTGGNGSYGNAGSPSIYEHFMRDGSGTPLINYANDSLALGSLLTSNDLWFHGSNAMAATNGSPIKMYAPSTWVPGSSYSHLDDATWGGTERSKLMVSSMPYGVSIHDPGPVVLGVLKDLGWPMATYSILLDDKFDATDLDTSRWKRISASRGENYVGNSSTVHDGYLDLVMNQTDNGGAVVSRFAPQKRLRVTLTHNMHPGGGYFFPTIYLESAVSQTIVNLSWLKSGYGPDYCNNAAKYDRLRLIVTQPGNWCDTAVFSSVASSSYYDRWTTAVLEYDMESGLVTVDLDNNGTIDMQATAPAGSRVPVTGVGLHGFGWYTGHWHRIDSIKVEGTTGFTAPGAPIITRLIPGDTSMKVVFAPPASDGGSAIIGYTATCAGGGTFTASGTGSPLTVTGLTKGVNYACTVKATNGAGSGAESAAMAKVARRVGGIAPLLGVILQ